MVKYKRYMVFECPDYYPNGGISDCKADFDTLEEAEAFIEPLSYDANASIFDRIEGIEIYETT